MVKRIFTKEELLDPKNHELVKRPDIDPNGKVEISYVSPEMLRVLKKGKSFSELTEEEQKLFSYNEDEL